MFARDLQALEGTPYHMDAFEVNAVNYGAPQIRERVLFIGNRYNAQVDFPAPTHHNPADVEADGGRRTRDRLAVAVPWGCARQPA
jgi:DNA (cytosine-5)-methyltransferase 1